MTDFSGSICIAFPADYPADREDPHCTLIWLGYIDTFGLTKEEVQAVLDAGDYTPPARVKPLLPKIFGKGDERVVVLPLDDSDGALAALRNKIDAALAEIGASSASEYTDYVPHVTTEDYVPGQTRLYGYPVPATIGLSKAQLWWGDEHGV